MRKNILWRVLALMGTLAFVFAGCSVDSGSSNDNETDNSSTTTPNPGTSQGSATQDTPTATLPEGTSIEVVENNGWLNSAYVIFKQVADGITYEVTVDDEKIDDELIRYYDTYTYYEASESNGQTSWTKKTLPKVVRADALGLKAGDHKIAICAVGTNGKSDPTTFTASVVDHDRSGFAFAPSAATTPGAYKKDGTLKDKAIVLYVTAGTAKTVSYTAKKGTNSDKDATYTGLQDVLSEQSLKNLTVPLDIRIIGTIRLEDLDSIGSSKEGLQIKTTTNNGVTIEGVGHDAAVYGFGFLIREAHYTELSNLGVYNFMDDGISVDTNNNYLWIHNNDISYGDVGSDSDQAKGDGSLDFKKSTYSTLSYNHFWDSGKCNLLDAGEGSGTSASNYISYHHNWYDHSDSRHPRIRNASAVHVYNNYFDGNSKYGVGITTGASAFVEGNYFRNAHNPMLSSKQGTDALGAGTFSGEKGGVIKSYNNMFAQNNTNGVKFQFLTNKYDYTNNRELGEYKETEKTLGTPNGDGTYTIFDDTADKFATESLLAIEDASDKGGYYQISKGKTGFYIDVPANVQKVIVTAKCGSSNKTGTSNMLSVNGTAVSMDMAADYKPYEVAVSVTSDSTIEIKNVHSSNSMNVKGIKVIAASGWKTIVTSGADPKNIDAYEVDARGITVPNNVITRSGGTTYSNFDTNMGNSGLGLSADPSGPEQAKKDVIAYSGRHNPDFAYTFDNSKDDKDYAVNAALKALVVGYKSGLTKTQGTGSSGNGGGSGTTTPGGDSGDTGGNTGGGTTDPTPPSATGSAVISFDKSAATDNRVTYSTSKSYSSGNEQTYGDNKYSKGAKLNTGATLTLALEKEYSVTFVLGTDNNGYTKGLKIDNVAYPVTNTNIVKATLGAGTHTVTNGGSETSVFLIILE